MKAEYLNPELKIVSFEAEDIITTSGGGGNVVDSLFNNLLAELDINHNNVIDANEWTLD